MALTAFILILIIAIYSLSISFFSSGLKPLRRSGNQKPDSLLPVSILIPFKNERSSLPHLVNDLIAQTYPIEMMDIVFVNDHSEDGSQIIFESLSRNQFAISCLDLPEGKRGKKEALAYGIQHAAHEWIIQIDADCRIEPAFVASHMAFLEKNPSDLVAGLVTTRNVSGRFLEHFERLDLLSLAGVGAASFHFGRPMICSGANLAYSKDLYLNSRPFDPSGRLASGDDMFLMIGARKLGRTLSYNLNADSVVRTAPVLSLRSFLAQRHRWGGKTMHYRMPDIQVLAILVVLTNLSMLLFPLGLILLPELWPWFLGTWLAKTTADFILLYRITGYTQQRGSMWMFLPVSLVYYPVFLLILISLMTRRPAWKGQHIS
jgi:biofilm PGA synthesis N-glycosyltransferase PgaC